MWSQPPLLIIFNNNTDRCKQTIKLCKDSLHSKWLHTRKNEQYQYWQHSTQHFYEEEQNTSNVTCPCHDRVEDVTRPCHDRVEDVTCACHDRAEDVTCPCHDIAVM